MDPTSWIDGASIALPALKSVVSPGGAAGPSSAFSAPSTTGGMFDFGSPFTVSTGHSSQSTLPSWIYYAAAAVGLVYAWKKLKS